MFIDILRARIQILLREKDLPFWGIVFPIFLSTFLFLGSDTKVPHTMAMQSRTLAQTSASCVTPIFIGQEGRFNSLVYFLAIIAIVCMLMGFMGNREMEDGLCWVSSKAVRMNVAPVSKVQIFLAGLIAAWGLANLFIVVVALYIKFVLGIGMGGPLMGWVLLIEESSLLGILVGMVFGAMSKTYRVIKQGQIAVYGVGGGVLAGLVDDSVKFYVDAYLPIISKLNPTSVMVEGMYNLSVYGMNKQFSYSLLRLGVMNVICLGVLILLIRRKGI